MPKKKKLEEIDYTKESEFVYCSLRHCPHRECLRHNINTPFNTVIRRTKFKPDENWNCKDITL